MLVMPVSHTRTVSRIVSFIMKRLWTVVAWSTGWSLEQKKNSGHFS